ncbi:MAG: hypothetical protein RIC16_15355 [Rhodospirillales bacterium]
MDVEDYVANNVLREGESIVWRGRPETGVSFKRNWMKTAFGVVFFAFAIFWTIGASIEGGWFGLFGLPFVAVGFWLVSTPWRDARRANRTYYAVTDKRALIIKVGREVTTTTIAPGDIDGLRRTDRPDGSGDLRLREPAPANRRGNISLDSGFTDGFWGVQDIKGAAAAVSAMMSAAR